MWALELTLPKNQHSPAQFFELLLFADIPFRVACQFGLPPFGAGFGNLGILAVLVVVPKATVYKNYGLVFWQNNIRFSWKFFVLGSINSEAITATV